MKRHIAFPFAKWVFSLACIALPAAWAAGAPDTRTANAAQSTREQIASTEQTPRSLFDRALACYYGIGRKIDLLQSRQWFTEACDGGDPIAVMWCAQQYFLGEGGFPIDTGRAAALAERSLPAVREQAEQGLPIACGLLGTCYSFGIGIDKSQPQAERWWNKGAAFDDPLSLLRLGLRQPYNCHRIQLRRESVDYLRRLAALGHSMGSYGLGLCAFHGVGIQRDYKVAAEYLREAMEQDNPWALYLLGYMYYAGLGVQMNLDEAKRIYMLGYNLGEKQATYILGYMHEMGLGYEQDFRRAYEYYEKAVALGSADASINLIKLHFFGAGVEKDYDRAFELAEGLAGLDYYPYADVFLGWLYTEKGERRDFSKALYHLTRAAENGYAEAEVNLGHLYEMGLGVDPDERMAENLYRSAASGHAIGKSAYACFLLCRERDVLEAVKLAEEAFHDDTFRHPTVTLVAALASAHKANKEEALSLLQQAADEYLEAIPELSGEYYSIAGRVYEQLGDPQKALANYESALASDDAADSKTAREQIAGWIEHLRSEGR
jgi:hypothetical protein